MLGQVEENHHTSTLQTGVKPLTCAGHCKITQIRKIKASLRGVLVPTEESESFHIARPQIQNPEYTRVIKVNPM